jgi:hypothetical protein
MEVAEGRRVRFYLTSEDDFQKFERACKSELLSVSIVRAGKDPDDDGET